MRLAMLSRMTKINSYKDLRVWQQGMDVVDLCFDIIDVLPTKYCFIFCNQLLRAESAGRMLHALVRSLEQ